MKEANRPLGPVSPVVNAKETFLMLAREPGMIRKESSLTADMETVLVVWREYQTSHSIPLSQKQIQSKALSFFSSVKA